MKKVLLFLTAVFLFLFVACSATYKSPETIKQTYTFNFSASKEQIYNAIITAISQEGYVVAYSDRELGIINTGMSRKELTEIDCDCGTTMGIPYIKDKRTVTDVALNFTIFDNKFEIRTNITGEYLPNDPVYGKKFECVSLGTIEENLYRRIISHLR